MKNTVFTYKPEVTLLEYMGSDISIVNAARVSFNKHKNVLDEQDIKLLQYLANPDDINNGFKIQHFSPFCHAFLSFRITAPIFVARQLVKHQVGLSWNEISRRYTTDEISFYIPKGFRKKAENVKQGSSKELVEHIDISNTSGTDPISFVEGSCECAFNDYQMLLEAGVCPEQARMILPLNTNTTWIWSGSLYAFIRICALRLHKHAQEETQLVAKDIYTLSRSVFPHSIAAFFDNSNVKNSED